MVLPEVNRRRNWQPEDKKAEERKGWKRCNNEILKTCFCL